MTVTNDPEEYRDRWNEHIDQLSAIALALDGEEVTELRELQDEIRVLVDSAASQFE